MKPCCPTCGKVFNGCSTIDILVLEGDDRFTRTYYCYSCKKAFSGEEVEPAKSEKKIQDVVCPQCDYQFTLDYMDSRPTLRIRSFPSGGVYDVSIRCPACDYEEEL